MPDYNLGRAHGTVRVDYDSTGVEQAVDDLGNLGEASGKSSDQIEADARRNEQEFQRLSAAARQLEADVVRATVHEAAAKARLQAAEQSLAQTRARSAASAKDVKDAERSVESAQVRSMAASNRLANAHRALGIAQQRLARIPRPNLTPQVDRSALQNIMRSLQNIDRSTHTGIVGLNTFSARLRALIAITALASPTVAGLGVSLITLAGAAGVATGGLAALIATGATLATVFSGVGEVFKQAANQQKTAGASAVQSATQQRAAARQIEQSLVGVRDAHEAVIRVQEDAVRAALEASRQIISAERGIRDAQVDAMRAQQDLNKARIDATRFLQDLRDELVGGALDERQALINVQRAQLELNRIMADPRVSDLDRQQAVLNLEQEEHALQRVRTQNQRLVSDQEDAARTGVEGSGAVVDAQQQVLHSAEALADAHNAMSDAVFQAARQQVDSQRAIRDSVEALANAQKDLQDAYAQAAEAGMSGANKMADALANISPVARTLVQSILAQSAAWREVKFAVQDAAFAGLADEVKPLATQWLPILKTGLVAVAEALNIVAKDVIGFLHTTQATDDVRVIFDNTAKAVRALAPAIRDLLAIFLDISAVGSSFLPGLAKSLSDMTARWRANTEAAKESGKAHEWMAAAMQAARELGALLGNLIGIVVTLFTAFDQEGGSTLAVLVNMTQKLEDFLHTAEGHAMLVELGKVLAELGRLLGIVLVAALDAFGSALVIIGPDLEDMIHMIADEWVVALKVLKPLLEGVAFILDFLGPVLVPVIASMIALNKVVKIAAVVWRVLNGVMKSNPFILIASLIIALVFLIIENWDTLGPKLEIIWNNIKDKAEEIWNAIKLAIVDPVTTAVTNVTDAFTLMQQQVAETWQNMMNIVSVLVGLFVRTFVDPVRQGIQNVKDFFNGLGSWVSDFFRNARDWLFSAGRDIIDGLMRGINMKIDQLMDNIRSIGRAVSNAFSTVMQIFSPSKVFQKFGEFTMEGYLVGLDAMETDVINRVVEIAAQITQSGQPDAFTLPPRLAAPAARAGTAEAGSKTIIIQNLTIPVTGNLDPTNPTQWRRAMQDIRETIRNIEKQEKVS